MGYGKLKHEVEMI